MIGILFLGTIALVTVYCLTWSLLRGVAFYHIGRAQSSEFPVTTRRDKPVQYWLSIAILVGPAIAFSFMFFAAAIGFVDGTTVGAVR